MFLSSFPLITLQYNQEGTGKSGGDLLYYSWKRRLLLKIYLLTSPERAKTPQNAKNRTPKREKHSNNDANPCFFLLKKASLALGVQKKST